MIYRPQFFAIHELVPPSIWNTRGEAAWELLDPRLLIALDTLRGRFGPIIVNNWKAGGQYKESGYRTSDTTTGTRLSQHRMGRAADCKFREFEAQEVYEYILANPDEVPEITCVEDIEHTPTWLHVDVRNCERIKVVRP